MSNDKVQISNEAQMSNPPNPPLLKGGEGGLSIDFELFHSFDIWILTFGFLDSVSYRVLSSLDS
jgi:hypothetical protein